MRGAPAWRGWRSVQHPSTVSALRADPPSPTRGEGIDEPRQEIRPFARERADLRPAVDHRGAASHPAL
ncbi:MAG: hypothetical protein EOQ98_14360 [Mesorhizobium sp.]|nr:MAG: hypothetical protein EOR96_15000 [Mesorhizobium sp.]RWO98852.1 MAG: hypothetical protein EOQ98_14360 [Mesorhizobium sp.]